MCATTTIMTEDPTAAQENDSSSFSCYSRHPVIPLLVWTSLNAIALAASIFLAIQLVWAIDDWHERKYAAAFYIVWNFATTALWLVEISFRVYEWRKYHRRTTTTTTTTTATAAAATTMQTSLRSMTTVDSIELLLEWSFAVIFTLDAVKLLIKWKLKKQDIDEDLVEVVLNIIAFSYITVATLQDYHETSLARRNVDDDDDDDRIPHEAMPLVV